VLRLAHLNRVQSPIINRARQDLAWQFPEVALALAVRYGENLPLLWGWLAGERPSKKKVRSALRRVNRLRNSRLGSSARRQTKAACSVSSWRSSKNYINCLPFHSLPVTEKFLRALDLVSKLKRCYFLRFTRCKIILPRANLKSKFATVAGLENQPNGIYRCDGL
jgi:hypothetical protein